MSRFGRYPLNIPSLTEAFANFQQNVSGSNQRRDRQDYDDRRFRDRDRDTRRDDEYGRRDSGGARGRSSRERFSPEPSYSSYLDDHRQGSQSNLVSYPLGHLNSSRSDRGNNRNDRNHNQNRDRYRNNSTNNRSQGNRSSTNQGPGILGAKPGDRSVPELPSNPLQVPALGLSGGGNNPTAGLTAQLAQQQQQLMAMVQTQSLLAAMQAQANANAQAQVQQAKRAMPNSLGGLLPTPLIPRTGGRDMQRQNRKRRNDGWGGGNFANKRDRPDRNRGQQGFNRGSNFQNRGRQFGGGAQSHQAKKTTVTTKEETKDEEVNEEEVEEEDVEEGGDNEQEVKELHEEEKQEQDSVNERPRANEFNQPPLPKSTNFLGEDVDSLMISLYDRKRNKYICQECKIICNLPMSFHKHLLGKRHARTVLESRGQEFEDAKFRSFSQGTTPTDKSGTEEVSTANESDDREKLSVEEVSSPSALHSPGPDFNLDFVKYTCNTRKTAMKEGDVVTISSVTQSRVQIEGFTSGRNMLGCEFVKAVSGFNCRLCKAFIRCGNDVITHIKGKKHQKNYQTYAQEHPQYEDHQLLRNKELEQVLEPKEGEEVVLYEVLDKDIKSSSSKQRSHRKDSQSEQQPEVPITKFVVAPEGYDEDSQLQINCEAVDVHLDLGDLDNINEDSLLADQSGDEHGESTLEEKFPIFGQIEQFGDEEVPESDLSLSGTTPQLDDVEDFTPMATDESVNNEEVEEPIPPVSIPPGQNVELVEPETPTSSQEEVEESPPVRETTPTGRRGRKNARGGAGRGGTARGRGRGRGTKRGTRAATGAGKSSKAKKVKVEVAPENDDMDLMEGFEIIDEIGDAED